MVAAIKDNFPIPDMIILCRVPAVLFTCAVIKTITVIRIVHWSGLIVTQKERLRGTNSTVGVAVGVATSTIEDDRDGA